MTPAHRAAPPLELLCDLAVAVGVTVEVGAGPAVRQTATATPKRWVMAISL